MMLPFMLFWLVSLVGADLPCDSDSDCALYQLYGNDVGDYCCGNDRCYDSCAGLEIFTHQLQSATIKKLQYQDLSELIELSQIN